MEVWFALAMLFMSQFFGLDLGGVQAPSNENLEVEEIVQVVSVVDGDTIRVRLDGEVTTVRYIGIDTPEPYRDAAPACYSSEASARNRELVADREVRLVPDIENKDKYDRLLRYVYVDDMLVNEQLVSEGYATTMTIKPNTQFQTRFAAAQVDARSAGRGLWTACQ